MKISTIIFDADGVVIDAPTRFSTYLEKEYAITLEHTISFFKGVFQKCLTGEADLKEELPQYLVEWGWAEGLDQFLKIWFESEHFLNKKMIKYIYKLKDKGLNLIVATNQEKYRTDYIREQMGLGDLVDKVYSSAYIGVKKPNRTFYTTILKELNITPEETIFWDDDPENVDGGNEVKINSHLYKNFEEFLEVMKGYSL